MKKALIAGTCLIMVITAVYLANSVAINKSYSKARIMESPVNISDIKGTKSNSPITMEKFL
jgi:hypothetical protein